MTLRILALWVFSCPLGGQTPVTQPIPFSHKAHVALDLKCLECHTGAKTADQAGIPKTGKCMACHVVVKPESPAIKILADADKAGKKIPWVRVYRVPDFVFFSHASHLKASLSCANCHGPVEQRDVLAKEVGTDMATCVKCHTARRASTDCALCHQLGH